MSAATVNAEQWSALFTSNGFAGSGNYIIKDTANNIAALQAYQLSSLRGLSEIEASDGSLIVNGDQAKYILNVDQEGLETPPYVQLAAANGLVIFADSAATVLDRSSYYFSQLEIAGVNDVEILDTVNNILNLTTSEIQAAGTNINTIGIVDTAANIEKLTAAQIQALATLGVTTITATDASVGLSVDEALNLLNAPANFEVAAPANDTVAVVGTAADLTTLDTTHISELQQLGVTAVAVDEAVRPEFSVAQLAALVGASVVIDEFPAVQSLPSSEIDSTHLAPGVAYNVTATPADFENNTLSADAISAASSQVVSITLGGSVTLSVAQAEALENASIPIIASSGDTITLVGTAAALQGMSVDQLEALKFIGVNAIAASDTPAVFSADQMNALQTAGIPIVAPPNNSSQNDGSYDVANPNGLTIDVTWDPSVASAPASFKATVEAGVNILERTITNEITVNIDVGYGEFSGNGSLLPLNISEGGPEGYSLSYSDLHSALALYGTTSAAITAVNSLPYTSSLDGQSNFAIGTAEAKALGLMNDDGAVDGWVGFGTDFTSTELVDAALHEISHALGRVPGNSALSLYRYTTTSDGKVVHDYQNNNPPPDAAPSYFSIDGGATALADFGETSDTSDFLNSPGSTLTPNDPLDEVVEGDGDLTPQDLVMLNVLGFQINPIESYYASDIEAFSSSDLDLLASVGVTQIAPRDPLVTLSVAQVETWENLGAIFILPSAGTVALVDTVADIEGLSAMQLDGLASIGINAITVTDGANLKVLDAALLEHTYAVATSDSITPLELTAPGGGGLTIVDTVADIELLSTEQLESLSTINVTQIMTGGDWQLSLAEAQALESAGVHVGQEAGAPPLTVAVTDSSFTASDIGGFAAIGVTQIAASGNVVLSVAEATELENAGITMVQQEGAAPLVVTVDLDQSDPVVTSPSLADIEEFASIGVKQIAAEDPVLSVDEVRALEQEEIKIVVPSESTPVPVSIEDTSAKLQTLTPQEIDGLRDIIPNPFGGPGFDGAISSSAAVYPQYLVDFDVAQLAALDQSLIPVGSLEFVLADTAAHIEAMTPADIAAWQSYESQYGGGANPVVVTDSSSLALSFAQAGALLPYLEFPSARDDIGSVSIADTAGDIKAFLDQGVTNATERLQYGGPNSPAAADITGIAATDGPVALSVSEAETLEAANAALGTNIAITAPPGDAVALSDLAGAIEGMSQQQLAGLSSIGVTEVDVTDQSLVLSVAQALALLDPVSIAAPPGDTVIVVGSEAEIDGLTQSEIEGLAAIGVQEIDVSNLAGAAPLTIDGGIELSISGAVPSSQTITFAGTGGTLGLSDDIPGTDVAGTTYGFSPPDRIDLTDVPFDPFGGAALGTDPNDNEPAIQVVENGNTYYLDIDPSQVFLTTPTFELNQDSTGNGTDLTVVEPSVTDQPLQVSSGQTSDGIVIAGGGEVEAESGATVNRAVVQNGGELLGDGGSTINDAFIQSGGLLDLATAAAGSGNVDFGPVVADTGGTLEIDDNSQLEATIKGFAAGDTIDLIAIPYETDGNGTAGLGSAPSDGHRAIVVTENGNSYYLDVDPSQNFAGDYFFLSPDAGGTGTDVTENVALPGFYLPAGALAPIIDPAGTYTNLPGAIAAIPAQPGYYDPGSGNTAQIIDPAGTYTSVAGSAAATPAAPGLYDPGTGNTTSFAAQPGYYDPGTGNSVQIIDPTGTYTSVAGSAAATPAAPGFYDPGTGNTASFAAQPGYYDPGTGNSTQIIDPAGTYTSVAGSDAATPAAPGFYDPGTGNTTSFAAQPGYYDPGTGNSTQIIDPAGTYTSVAGSDAATPAPAGSYDPGTGNTASFAAQPGYYDPGTGNSAQIIDPAGTYTSIAGLDAAVPAPTGYYDSGTGNLTPFEAQPGYYDPGTGNSAQVIDPAGYYTSLTGSAAAVPAAPGSYDPGTGNTASLVAPPGTFVSEFAAAAPTTDPVGSYSAAGASAAILVDGFTAGGPFDLTAVPFDPSAPQPVLLNNGIQQNLLQITENGVTYGLQLDPDQDYSQTTFQAFPDQSGTGTEITENTPCYCRGTLILTARGEELVENLKISDRVMTKAGVARPIKWIGRRSYGGRFVLGRKDILPVCIKAGALGDSVPRRDLWISPHHAMYLEGVLIEAKELINGVSIVQAERAEKVEYFHIELATHDVIIAEGALSESFIDDDSRGLFHNAHEYRTLYPDGSIGPVRYCAPRCEEGYEVAAARRCIALRAGLRLDAEEPRIGNVRGYIDRVGPRQITGWAQNVDHPEAPMCLDIYAGGRLIGRTLANCYREDLKRAGLGSGHHSFTFTPPAGITVAPASVEVRRSLDGSVIPFSRPVTG